MLMKSNRLIAWCRKMLPVLTCLFLCAFPSSASESIDLDKDVTLTLIYKDDSKPVAGAGFEMYHVGNISEAGEFSLMGDFVKYPVSVDNLDTTGWRNLAITLNGYAQRDNLAPIDVAQTDKNGVLTFPAQMDALKPGLYLVTGDKHKQEQKIYTAEPFMAWLPDKNEVFEEWSYDVTAVPKHENKPGDSDSDTIKRKVLKVWNDTNHTNKRPKTVTVDLLQDGSVYETIALNAENNWRYSWNELSDEYTWTVVEKEPKDYQVSVGKEGITFVITNTYITPPDNPGDDDDDGGGDDGGGGNDPDGSSPPADMTIIEPIPAPTGNMLPQTGQLWWPVPLLIVAGLIFLIVGLVSGRGDKYDE